MQTKILTRKNIALLFVVMLSFFLITRIPVRLIYELFLDEYMAEQARYGTLAILILLTCWIIASKYELLAAGGFVARQKRNYWMLLIPLIFPGMIFFNSIREGCLVDGEEWMVASASIFVGAMMEEVLCRGLIQGYLIRFHPYASRFRIVFASAAVFALLHLIGLMNLSIWNILNQVIYALMVGLVLGAVMLRVRNVWLLGVIHGILNILGKGCNNNSEMVAEEISIGQYFLDLLILILILSPTVLIYWLLIRSEPRK